MGAQNHSLESSMQDENNDSWKDEFADEETLSLCDLVTSSDSDEYWNSNSSSTDHHHHQDFFEFFGQDFPAAATSTFLESGNNIIFCGKLIPHKDHSHHQQQQQQKPSVEHKEFQSMDSKIMDKKEELDDDQAVKNSTTTSCLFPWKNMSYSFKKSRTYPSRKASKAKNLRKSLSLPLDAVAGSKHGGYGSSDYDKFDLSVKKVSILTTPVKSRWHLFAFGVGRFPMEIELKDMKLRQSRKSKAMKKIQAEGGDSAGIQGNVVNGGKEGKRSGKGLWRLIKVLGWKSKEIKQVEY